jgi:MFS family permease
MPGRSLAARRPTIGAEEPVRNGAPAKPYERDRVTWVAFFALSAFGVLNAVLGPALPYLSAEEGISYLVGALHQVAFAIGGGLAGLLAARRLVSGARTVVIAAGLTGAGLAVLLLGYGVTPPLTIAAAFVLGLLATTALIAIWAALADIHGDRRAVAMTEGEVAVSLAGVLTPAIISGLAATVLGWRFAFVVAAFWAVVAAIAVARGAIPRAAPAKSAAEGRPRRLLPPTLLLAATATALEFSLSFWLASYLADDIGLPRDAAVVAVSGLYLASLVGRLAASRIVRQATPERVLAGALIIVFVGLPFLLAAEDAVIAAVGIAIVGAGIGATFPLASALHIQISGLESDHALGQTLATTSIGQILGPLGVGVIAQAASLRAGLLVLPVLTVTAAALLATVVAGGSESKRERCAQAD